MKPRRSITRSRLSAAVLAATCPAAEAAYAQGRATPVVEEVVVTAQKRAERLVDVPIAITAASGDTLERVGITRLEEISQIAPAAQISRIGTYVQPAIRGVTTPLTGVGAENNVAIYIDGFYQAFQRGLNLDLANVAQVQILKGPQGTLFGRNTTGGAFLIDTLQPSLADRNGRFSLSYARFDDIQAQAYFSTPLSSTLAFNIMGYVRKSDGYIKDVRGFDTAPISNHSVNAKLLWAPSDALSVTASIENVKVSDGTSLAPTIIARSQAQSLVPTTYVETGRNRTSVNHPVTDRSVQWAGSLKAQYRTDWATLSSFTRYGKEWDYLDFENDGSTVRVFDNITKETGRVLAGGEPHLGGIGAGELGAGRVLLPLPRHVPAEPDHLLPCDGLHRRQRQFQVRNRIRRLRRRHLARRREALPDGGRPLQRRAQAPTNLQWRQGRDQSQQGEMGRDHAARGRAL
jgi:iron complex outermembrane receptor protein